MSIFEWTTQPEKLTAWNKQLCNFNIDGDVYYEVNGTLHHPLKPAVVYANGTKKWFQNGQLHRIGGPSIEYSNGGKEWHQHGKLHRLDGPAIEHSSGSKEWWYQGSFARGVRSQEEFEAWIKSLGVK